jgi:hypothetical protein
MKNANIYRKELSEIKAKEIALKNSIGKRLYTLALNYPDAIVSKVGDTPIKAKRIASAFYIESIELSAQIDCIERIEKYIESISPVKQLEINWENIK